MSTFLGLTAIFVAVVVLSVDRVKGSFEPTDQKKIRYFLIY